MFCRESFGRGCRSTRILMDNTKRATLADDAFFIINGSSVRTVFERFSEPTKPCVRAFGKGFQGCWKISGSKIPERFPAAFYKTRFPDRMIEKDWVQKKIHQPELSSPDEYW